MGHLFNVKKTYFSHLCFAWRIGFKLIIGGFALLLHGVFPNMLVDIGSNVIKSVIKELE